MRAIGILFNLAALTFLASSAAFVLEKSTSMLHAFFCGVLLGVSFYNTAIVILGSKP